MTMTSSSWASVNVTPWLLSVPVEVHRWQDKGGEAGHALLFAQRVDGGQRLARRQLPLSIRCRRSAAMRWHGRPWRWLTVATVAARLGQ